MSWLVDVAVCTDHAAVRDDAPAVWRDVRRFQAPVQLAVAAGHAVAARAVSAADVALISLAPCQTGSPELHRWVREIESGAVVRMNPTHTLHAVDNLALSVLSIGLGTRGWAMSLGGTAGMAWAALELVQERIELEREVVVVAGDQRSGRDTSPAAAIAMLFARERTELSNTRRFVRLAGIERERPTRRAEVSAHAADGLIHMHDTLSKAPSGRFAYVAPDPHGDGFDTIIVHWEIDG